MYSDYYETLIHKHLSGELTSSEEQSLNTWLEESPQHRAHLQEAERIWELAGADPQFSLDIDLEHEIARFNDRVHNENAARVEAPAPAPGAHGLRLIWRYAAAAVLLLGAVMFLMQSKGGGMVLIETAANETREVILPDESTVLLNEHSRIAFDEGFSERFVQMHGEVFFDVQHDASRPFRIQSGKGWVEVLGTSFVVRYRPQEPEIRVTVSTGRVAFGVPELNQQEILEPGYSGTLVKATNTLSVAPNEDPNFQVWRNRSLAFDETPLIDVVQVLRTHFGIVIDAIDPGLERCTFSGEFESPQLDAVLDMLSFTVDIDISVQDGVYEFSGVGCMQ